MNQPDPNTPFQPPTPAAPNWLPNTQPQIFLHPDHEELKKQFASKPERNFDHATLFLGVAGLLLLIVASVSWFVFWPKIQAFQFARSAHETVYNSQKKTDEVDNSLKKYYAAINPKETDTILSAVRLTQSSADLSDQANSIGQIGQDLFSQSIFLFQEGQVKAFTTPETDPNKEIRDRRQLAKEIKNSAEEAEELNQEFGALLSKSVPSNTNDIRDDLKSLQEDTDYYIDQANKTSIYYTSVADASIELNKLASATLTFNDIDPTISKLTALKTKFSSQNKGDLPEEIDSFNADLVDMLDLLVRFYKEVKILENASASAQQEAISRYQNEITSIAVGMQTDQLNFWKNNSALSGYDDLSNRQTDLLKETRKVGAKNDFFLLKWMGVRIETNES